MTVSPPFYVIQSMQGMRYFNCGKWSKQIERVRRYSTPERAAVDCEEWALTYEFDRIVIAPYRLNIGHHGQTVILPA